MKERLGVTEIEILPLILYVEYIKVSNLLHTSPGYILDSSSLRISKGQ